jgi:hypothetical protein
MTRTIRNRGRRGLAVLIGTVAMVAGAFGLATSAVGATLTAPSAVVAANGVDPELNKPSYWVDYFTKQGYEDVECTKYEPVSTPYILGDPPEGRMWLAIVIKAGAGNDANEVIMNPKPGEYSHASGKDNSHVIVCSVPEKTHTTTTSTTTTHTTSTTTTPMTSTTTTPVTSTTTTHTTTKPPTGPVVETDVVSGGSGPSWVLMGSLTSLLLGAGLVAFGLRQRGSHR